MILSRLASTHQDLSGNVKVVDREQELVELHLSKFGLFLQVPKAYSPRPPKEIVAHCHYSPARLTVTDCFSQWLVSFLSFPLFRISGYLFAVGFFVVGVATDIFLFPWNSRVVGRELICSASG